MPVQPDARPTRRAATARRNRPLSPIDPGRFGFDEARHLLWRAGFGGTPSQVGALAALGPQEAVEYLLNVEEVEYAGIGLDRFDKDIMSPPSAEERQVMAMARRSQDEDALAQLRTLRQQRERDDRAQMQKIQKWWLTRMIETPRPLEEKMTLFWHGHFATSYRTIENSYHMFAQNIFLRKHALGNFADLLFGIIRDPAMLAYLDNNDSRKGRPNENLAREIMELFSLGVGSYTEEDIKEGARALTGYTFDDDEFIFARANHDENPKSILGRSGRLDGDDFVAAILEQRACSEFIAAKLYRFFCADAPADARDASGEAREVIDGMADAFLAARYDLRPVLRRLFLSEHFYDQAIRGEHIKGPAELVVSAIRSLRTPVRDLSILNDAMDLMGQDLFFPPSVKGWDGGRSWINTSTLFVRQNVLTFLLTGKKPAGYDPLANEERFDPAWLVDELAAVDPAVGTDDDALIDMLLRFNLGPVPAHGRGTLRAFAAGLGDSRRAQALTGMLLLITAMPEYQLC